jgi:hypothetical protein
MAFVMAEAQMMLMLAVILSAGLRIYSCARAAAAFWRRRGIHTYGLDGSRMSFDDLRAYFEPVSGQSDSCAAAAGDHLDGGAAAGGGRD